MAHLTLPSEVEPESLADLVADCRSLEALETADTAHAADTAATHAHAGRRPAEASGEHSAVTIPDSTAALLEGMPEYGD